jgi:hypothetical protein
MLSLVGILLERLLLNSWILISCCIQFCDLFPLSAIFYIFYAFHTLQTEIFTADGSWNMYLLTSEVTHQLLDPVC